MSYFTDGYSHFKYTVGSEDQPGLRNAQLAALHSIAAHFLHRNEPGIITMPTGSGKTAVLIASAFILRAARVLIITPSRLVREQIVNEAQTLDTIKRAEALPQNYPGPSVKAVGSKVSSNEGWEALRACDVVVASIQSISPEYDEIPEPPADLFDLVLVDEAHHSPARTWQRLLDHFSSAKRILFTATPYRQDQKEIKGRFLYSYGLREAYKDGIFGEIVFQPVEPEENQPADEAIALAVQQRFNEDSENKLQHRVMVRTDGVARAKQLLEVYRRETALRLALITGAHSLKHVKTVVKQLTNGDLDGIVCVNMFGEGFNLPSLKIAAIHAPHKSLSVTLQFVGRFARTVGENLGRATFLAIPSEVEVEAERLYDARAVWSEIIPNLSASRIEGEAEMREVLQSFEEVEVSPDLSDLSLYSLTPYFHVKIYKLEADIDIEEAVELPGRFQQVYRSVSVPHNASIYITREELQPRWTDDDRLSNIRSDLFIFYYDADTKLLFICSSQRGEGVYSELIKSFGSANPRPLALARLNRALNDLTATEFFNVGMRNRVASNNAESYRIIAGSNAERTVSKSDGRLYHRGHLFGRANDNGAMITIGLSSGSKIWSNMSSRLPDLIRWCFKLAAKIESGREPVTNSGLDFLSVGEELEQLPPDIIAVDWTKDIYVNQPIASYPTENGAVVKAPLVDFDIRVNKEESTDQAILLELMHGDMIFKLTFSLVTDRLFEPCEGVQPEVKVEADRVNVPFIDFINEHLLLFYTGDLSVTDGLSFYKADQQYLPFDGRQIEVLQWADGNVNIQREFGDAGNGRVSVHEFIESVIAADAPDVAYYDHGTGEIADFITFKLDQGRLAIRFYHCKGSKSENPGRNVANLADLTNQIVKSVHWSKKDRILRTIRRRFRNNIGSHRFVVSDLEGLERLLEPIAPALIDYYFIAVQPGLLSADLPEEISNILAAASDHLTRGGFKPLTVMAS